MNFRDSSGYRRSRWLGLSLDRLTLRGRTSHGGRINLYPDFDNQTVSSRRARL